MTAAEIRVVLADDHPMVRNGLHQLLSMDERIVVVGMAGTGAEAVEQVLEHGPDVVLMDLQMPDTDGVTATRLLQDQAPAAQVVILTSFSDRERIVAALEAGAIGYLLKDAEPEELLAGVHAAVRGESPLHPRAAREMLSARDRGRRNRQQAADALTPREWEILALVRDGLANKQIARRLAISERTVKAHLTSIPFS